MYLSVASNVINIIGNLIGVFVLHAIHNVFNAAAFPFSCDEGLGCVQHSEGSVERRSGVKYRTCTSKNDVQVFILSRSKNLLKFRIEI